ncbi:MAG TPA: ATP-binding protein [Vicinamibacterales bacterium]|nr:ATP-binding protein [Vicinamibacterales bacterium]
MASLRVDARLEALAEIGTFVLQAAGKAGLDHRTAYRLRLAVDEVATNIVVHGRPGEHGGEPTIDVEAVIDPEHLTIAIEDHGPAFDPLTRERPDASELARPLTERPFGGLGVFLAIRCVDQFRYERIGQANRNILVVERPAPADGGLQGQAL